MAGIKRVDFSNIDTTGVSAGQQAVYVTANSRFEFVAADYVAAAGGGSGPAYLGTTAGYTLAVFSPLYTQGNDSFVAKFPFATESVSTVGNITYAPGYLGVYGAHSGASSTHGYSLGGRTYVPAFVYIATASKFPFASDTDDSPLGSTLAQSTGFGSTSMCGNNDFMYVTGGRDTPGYLDLLQKMPTTSDTTASDIGELTNAADAKANHSSPTHGYTSGGRGAPTFKDIIDKFPFSSDTSATDIGELVDIVYGGTGISSSTHGYVAGGLNPTAGNEKIQKFSFSSDVSATDVAETNISIELAGGVSSESYGYLTRGYERPATAYVNALQKFSTTSDASATDVTEFSNIGGFGSGLQT